MENKLANIINYILKYPDAGAAQRDIILAPYLSTALPVLFFQNVLLNSVTPASGYWLLVNSLTVDNALLADPNLVLAFNRSAQVNNQPSIISTTIPTANY